MLKPEVPFHSTHKLGPVKLGTSKLDTSGTVSLTFRVCSLVLLIACISLSLEAGPSTRNEAAEFSALWVWDSNSNLRLAVQWTDGPGARLSAWVEPGSAQGFSKKGLTKKGLTRKGLMEKGWAKKGWKKILDKVPWREEVQFFEVPEARGGEFGLPTLGLPTLGLPTLGLETSVWFELLGADGEKRRWVQEVAFWGDGPMAEPKMGGEPVQERCQWQPGYHLRGVGESVLAMISFDDGNGPALFVGGVLTSADELLATSAAKWDGSSWTPTPGPGMTIQSFAVFDDGSGPALYAGGGTTTSPGADTPFLAKWDGSEWLPIKDGVDGQVRAMTVFDDGSGPALFVAGSFLNAGGQPASRIAKWDGNQWSALGTGVDNGVRALATFDDGSGEALYVAGSFANAGGSAVARIAKWDGANWSALGSGFDADVYALTVFDDGGGEALFAGGSFGFSGSPSIAKWRAGAWSGVGDGLSHRVHALRVFDDGMGPALYAGGLLSSSGAVPVSGVAKWTGGGWAALGSGPNGRVGALADFDDGAGPALFVGGGFSIAGTEVANNMAKWRDSTWTAVTASGPNSGFDGGVTALAAHDHGAGPVLYAAGQFFAAGSAPAQRVAAWNGTAWSPLGSGVEGLGVQSLAIFDDGGGPALYAGGDFHTVGGTAVDNIARWDGGSWSPVGSGLDGVVNALAVFDDGGGPALYAAGNFLQAGAVGVSRIAKWDGISWSALGVGLNSQAYALTVFDDGNGPDLYVGGAFALAGGQAASRVARWDGTVWSSLPGELLNLGVFALAGLDDGSGPSLFAGGTESHPIDVARWNGSSWSALPDTDVGTITSLAAFDDGTGPALFVGGRGIRKWNGAWSALNGDLTGIPFFDPSQRVDALLPVDLGGGTTLIAGGLFRRAGGRASYRMAEYDCIAEPKLEIQDQVPALAGSSVEVPVTLSTDGAQLTDLSFSLDYDQSCLVFDPTDGDDDGLADAILFFGPAELMADVSFDAADTDGEVDVVVDVPGTAPAEFLSDGVLAIVTFGVICDPAPASFQGSRSRTSSTRLAAVDFSADPSAVFIENQVQALSGTVVDGSVLVYSGLRGDCNGEGQVDADDLLTEGYEIFDGDGNFWGQVGGGSVFGDPVGCDANGDFLVNAADLSCTHHLIAGSSCGVDPRSVAGARAGTGPSVLELGPWEVPVVDGSLTVELVLRSSGQLINSLAVSLNLDTLGFALDPTDDNADGLPDAVSLPGPVPSTIRAQWDATDADGELDLFLTQAGVDLSAALPDPFVIQIEVSLLGPPPSSGFVHQPFRFSYDPVFSLGGVDGQLVDGMIRVLGTDLFSHDFESGNTAAWSLTVP